MKNLRQKIALVDIDDVLTDTTSKILEEVNIRHKSSYTVDQMTTYYVWENFPITKEEVYQITITENIVASLEPISGALEGMVRIKKSNYLIWLVTARPEILRPITLNWLNRHGFRFDKLTMELNGSQKATLASRKVELAIEDRYDTALAFSEISNHVYLLTRPWNTGKPLPDNIIQVRSWNEVLVLS